MIIGKVFSALFYKFGEIVQEFPHAAVPVFQFFFRQVKFQGAQYGVCPALQHPAILMGEAQQVADHLNGDEGGEIGHRVELSFVFEPVQ